MKMDKAMTIYCGAIDPTATAAEGPEWWLEVQAEMELVMAAPTKAAAATVFARWKSEHDWAQFGDSPVRAAGSIRKMAKTVLKCSEKRPITDRRPEGGFGIDKVDMVSASDGSCRN